MAKSKQEKSVAKAGQQIDSRSGQEIILEALQGVYPKKSAGTHMMICCPFHEDGTPSLGIVIDPGHKFPVGTWNCLGCPEKGKWNKLATKMGLPLIQEWNNKQQDADAGAPTDEDDLALLGRSKVRNNGNGAMTLGVKLNSKRGGIPLSEKEKQALLKVATADASEDTTKLESIPDRNGVWNLLEATKQQEARPWPKTKPWRTYSGAFLAALGPGVAWYASGSDGPRLFFVAYVNGKAKGGVTARMKKSKDKNQMSYKTTRGEWIKNKGLLFYDVAKKMIEDKDIPYLILTEGPRDALRLLSYGIPAIAVLGAQTFGHMKALLVAALDVAVYVMPDNDKGGELLWNMANKELSSMNMPPNLISLPRRFDPESGKLIKVDPHTATDKLIQKLIKNLHSKHHWKPRRVPWKHVEYTRTPKFREQDHGNWKLTIDV